MPTWPSGTKAGTTNVDNGSDLIRLARPDIKQNIDNTNAIIDTFDPSGATNNDLLTYNSSTTKFEPASAIGLATTLVEFDGTIAMGSATSTADYNGGFSTVGANTIGVATGTSGSRSTLTFPAGTYQIGTATPLYYGTYGSSAGFNITFNLKKLSDSSQLFSEGVAATSFYFRNYNWYYVVTFASSTAVYVETIIVNNTTDTFGHTPLLINRLA